MINDEVAEWLRRWTANPMGSARVGSNPIGVANVLFLENIDPDIGASKEKSSKKK